MAITKLPAGFVVRSLPLPKDFDPLTASDQDLLGHGLPRRPQDPRLLSDWESLVRGFARSTFIEPEFLATDRQHGPMLRAGATSSVNWSGGVVRLPADPAEGAKFYTVTARFTVPDFFPTGLQDLPYHCSCWIGIDWVDDASMDIVQAGVHCVVVQRGSETSALLYPWWQWWPGPETQITNLLTLPGDVMSCVISTRSATVANVLLNNNNQYTAFEVTPPKGTTVVGNCAEWIVERPQIGGVASQLANYGSVAFQTAWAGTNLGGSDAIREPSQGDAFNMFGDDGSLVSRAELLDQEVDCFFVP
jgi:hypothetical protein